MVAAEEGELGIGGGGEEGEGGDGGHGKKMMRRETMRVCRGMEGSVCRCIRA